MGLEMKDRLVIGLAGRIGEDPAVVAVEQIAPLVELMGPDAQHFRSLGMGSERLRVRDRVDVEWHAQQIAWAAEPSGNS